MLQDLIRKNRSYRRFFEEERIERPLLEALIEGARLATSTSNKQPLRYALVDSAGPRDEVFDCLRWAGYLEDWSGPVEGERPSAYIVVMHDTQVDQKSEYVWCDAGIATQLILLQAAERGYGGCTLASVDRRTLLDVLGLPERYDILVVLALGKPKERVVITEVATSGDIKYYRDAEGTHYVPKRSLREVIVR